MNANDNANAHSEIRPGGRGLPAAEVYRGIKLVVFDVDGVLTDGRIAIDGNGIETKFFDVRDGTGMTLLDLAGIKMAMLSGRFSPVTDRRAKDVKVPTERVFQGVKYKLPVYLELLKSLGVQDHETAYMGDDVIDLPVLDRVAVACCPADARPEVRTACHVQATLPGGRGGVRQVCEHLLKARGDGAWDLALRRYLREDA
ncbi:MAG: phenylphosphate carboxylase subunit delta [Planctomycetes bacterium]|nr:phenylphosphate carboxylase subunit delta [Planctomycetota bacterium]